MGAHGFHGVRAFGAPLGFGMTSESPVAAGVKAIGEFYGSGGYAYRAYTGGPNGSIIFRIVTAPRGATLGKDVYQGQTGWSAIYGEYAKAAAKQGGILRTGTIASAYTTGATPKPTLTAPVAADRISTGSEKIPWWQALSSVTESVTPLVSGLVGGIASGGILAGDSTGDIAAKIARKERELAQTPTSNTPKRARLQAEIAQLRQQQAMYGDTVQGGLSEVGGGPLVEQDAGGAGWVLPAVIVAGLAVVGGAVWFGTRR